MLSVIEVFYQPGKLFESLRERPSAWIFPLFVDILVLVASIAVLINLVGIESLVRQRLQTTTMSPEQMQVAMQRMNSPFSDKALGLKAFSDVSRSRSDLVGLHDQHYALVRLYIDPTP